MSFFNYSFCIDDIAVSSTVKYMVFSVRLLSYIIGIRLSNTFDDFCTPLNTEYAAVMI